MTENYRTIWLQYYFQRVGDGNYCKNLVMISIRKKICSVCHACAR